MEIVPAGVVGPRPRELFNAVPDQNREKRSMREFKSIIIKIITYLWCTSSILPSAKARFSSIGRALMREFQRPLSWRGEVGPALNIVPFLLQVSKVIRMER